MRTALLVLCLLLSSVCTSSAIGEDGKWIQLFDGKSLAGWTPKIRYQEFGKDPGKTFRIKDGKMVVGYDKDAYPEFNETFGHIFYKEKYSHYRIRVEYRFVGEQVKGGPNWAYRNSGIMLHCQDPKSMRKDQKFPVSIEVQLLGGGGTEHRETSNLCTPGTNVVMAGELYEDHCCKSKSETYHGDQWVTAEVEVRGNEIIKHILDGEVVLEYTEPQLDPTDEDAKKLIEKNDGDQMLSEGYISLQSESHPVEFRKVELLPLTDKR